ncbi:hypothetical protein Pmani_021288 [Petrolisthes manimaculis]|uniref:U1-type domain-containing protein n=1 Tax=Petrolisthes manimaculis TaxID=1843537 RepID=A0AAE1U5M3_9EUCA|nr:hypothetical protein Pmani_021288 [Petrolisthes manimaculis]
MPKRKFREQWLQEENFRGWLRKVDGDDYSAFCNVCKSTLVTEVSTLKRHSSSRRHTEGLARQTAAPAAQPPPRDGDDDSVTLAKIREWYTAQVSAAQRQHWLRVYLDKQIWQHCFHLT